MNKYYFNQKTVLIALMLATCLLPSLTMQSSTSVKTLINQNEATMLKNSLIKMGAKLTPSDNAIDNAIIDYMIQTRDQGRADNLSQPLYKGLFSGTFSPEGALETFNAIKKLVKLGYSLPTINRPLIDAYNRLIEKPVWAGFEETNITTDQVNKALKIYQILTNLVDYKPILTADFFGAVKLGVLLYDNPIVKSIFENNSPQASIAQKKLIQSLKKYTDKLQEPEAVKENELKLALLKSGAFNNDLLTQYQTLSNSWRAQAADSKEIFKANNVADTDTLETFWNLLEEQQKEDAQAALAAFITSIPATATVTKITDADKEELRKQEADKYVLLDSDAQLIEQTMANKAEFNAKLNQAKQEFLNDLKKLQQIQ